MGCDIHMHVEYKSKQFTGEDILAAIKSELDKLNE